MPTKPKFSELTIERLQWLKAQVLKYPHRYNQHEWCGTKACLAGFCVPKAIKSKAITLSYEDRLSLGTKIYDFGLPYVVSGIAQEWLGITEAQSSKLFSSSWGSTPRFRKRYELAKTDEERAQVAADRIDYFLSTGK